jgi:glycerol-3-phosphate dehydrogenase
MKTVVVVRRQPTSVSIASLTPERAQAAAEVFHQPWFRWYARSLFELFPTLSPSQLYQ